MGYSDDTAFLGEGAGMVARVRAFDWAATALGPIRLWPAALKTAIGLALNSGFPKAVVCGPELVTIYNDGFVPILGRKHDCLGRSFRDIWHEVWEEIRPIQERAYAGQSTFIKDFQLEIQRNGYPEQAWFTFSYSPIRDETGRVIGMMDTVIETTDRVETERKISLVNRELEHRIKNTFTILGSIARQTFRHALSLESAQQAFENRLAALAATHTPLIRAQWSSAPIHTVIEGALAPYPAHAHQVELDGPALELAPRHALSLALAVNELAANALKYGALSTEAGRVRLSWRTGAPGGDEPFELVWQEQDGPPVAGSGRVGFGSQLIRAVGLNFGGSAELKLEPDGARFVLRTVMRRLVIETEAA